jgi:hypothetical protein
VRDEVAAPLGLHGTAYCEDGSPVPGRTRDYQSAPRRLSPTTYWSEAKFFASGGLCSTVIDLVRWAQALDAGRLISPEMLEAMRRPALLPGGMQADYGFGTRLGLSGPRRKLGHTGGGQSNKAVLTRYPDDDVTVAVLLNTERSNATVTATDVEQRIEELLFPRHAAAAAAASPADEDLARYAGEYREGYRLVRVAAEGGTLKLRSASKRRRDVPLIPGGDGSFVDSGEPSLRYRFQLNGSQAEGYRRYHNGWFVEVGVRAEEP